MNGPRMQIAGVRPDPALSGRFHLVLTGLVTATLMAACGQDAPVLKAGPPTQAALAAVRAAALDLQEHTALIAVTVSAADTFGGGKGSGSGGFDFPNREGALDFNVTSAQSSGLMMFLPQAVYFRQRNGGGSKPWKEVSVADRKSLAGRFNQNMLLIDSVNPDLYLVQIAGGAISAAPAGNATVSGHRVSEYVATVDLTKAGESLSGPAATVLSAALSAEETANHGSTTRVTVDVDDEGHLVGLSCTPPGAGVGTADFTFTAEGSRITVSTPPRNQTTDSVNDAGTETKGGDGDAS
jgi:hypothetical protein